MSSNVTIHFEISRDYRRLAALLHGLALILVWISSFSLFLMCLLSLALIYQGWRVVLHGRPAREDETLTKGALGWQLSTRSGQLTQFQQVLIGFDCGLFMILQLTGDEIRKNRVVFHDQLTADQYRVLKLQQERVLE